MTPTREQVIRLLIEAGHITCHPSNYTSDIDAAVIAYSAGRLKGLEEAKGTALATRDLDEEKRARDRAMAARGGDMENEVRKLDHYFTVVAYNAGLNKCAAAIDQLKEQK